MEIPFIQSLHRPLNKPLKCTRWVCEFIVNRDDIKSSMINIDFFYYLVKKLHKTYSTYLPGEYHGIPSKSAIDAIANYISSLNKTSLNDNLVAILQNKKRLGIEKQIYSVYKASSYFVNLAKDKFKLIDEKNNLTYTGERLLEIKTGAKFTLSAKEKEFYFERVLESDFLVFITYCNFQRIQLKYAIKNVTEYQYAFLEKFYNISHFNFTTPSLENYNTVRSYWIETLGVLNASKNLRNNYINIIKKNPTFEKWYEEIAINIKNFESTTFRQNLKYLKLKKLFIEEYDKFVKNQTEDLGFVNLHDLKSHLHTSFDNFELFLNQFYEDEKRSSKIFFSNIVNSVDRRQRFYVNKIPVLKIKIKK
ncbi:hypothetical protein NLG42_10530 [Flavobacterium plurextorum]|uniref:hypothetical protein n=1 Tax=Flavobacterium TaxID=237 RepID=UPI00214D4856|nr:MULTISPECIES: hypothetical protein [Flavobacterium]UUW11223.1 hypothetical protein NLG42_10530 [Flavobacterium plurextorum]